MFDCTKAAAVGNTWLQSWSTWAMAGVTMLATIAGPPVAFAADGELDRTFGVGGLVLTALPKVESAQGQAVVLQGDGKIVVAITASNFVLPLQSKTAIGVVRYNPDGSLDTTFNGTGFAIATSAGTVAADVALQSDGKIVVGGTSFENGAAAFLLVRFNTDGALDRTFGVDGRAIVRVSNDSFGEETLNAIAVSADGSIVSVGFGSFSGTGQDFVVTRHDANGTLDTTFGSGGIVVTPLPSFGELTGVAIQADGGIVAAGTAGFTDVANVAILHLLDDGRLDPAFGGGDGVVLIAVETFFVQTKDVVIQPDQRIVVGGHTLVTGKQQPFLTRLLPDGTLDSSFGEGGIAKGETGLIATDLALQADGSRIVVTGGHTTTGFPPDFTFIAGRFTSDGQVDAAFGASGVVTTNFLPGVATFEISRAAAVQADGKTVLVGGVGSNLAVARYLGPTPQRRIQ
jgi:uncharacterized delta-60 repeat protein